MDKVAYILKRYPRYSETFIVNEILALEALGIDLEIFALRPCSDTHFQNAISLVRAPVHYLPSAGVKAQDLWDALQDAGKEFDVRRALAEPAGAGPIDFYQALLLAREVKASGIAHMHAHFATSATTVSRLASILTGVPYSFTAHAKDIYHEDVRHDELQLKLSDAKMAVTVSEYNVSHLRETYDCPHLKLIFNGLMLDRFPFDAPGSRRPLVLFVGRLVPKKGHDVLLDACALLKARGVEFECEIVGGGELRFQLEAQAHRSGLEDLVRFRGPLPQSEVGELLGKASVFAAPCVVTDDGDRDGLPTVLLEAMAVGAPCVSTDVTGIPEVIRHGETGLLVGQRDPQSLADAIQALLEESELRIRLAKRARGLIEERFDVTANVRQLANVFGVAGALAGDAREPSCV